MIFQKKQKKPKIKDKSSYNKTSALANRPLTYIGIHYTATPSSIRGRAENVADHFANGPVKASADFITDEYETVQYNKDIRNRYCWAVGGSKYRTQGGQYYGIATNKNTISVEMCSRTTDGLLHDANDSHWEISSKVFKRTIKLVKWLMQEYDIPASRVLTHYQITGKPCPGVIGWNEDSGSTAEWEKFKKKLRKL